MSKQRNDAQQLAIGLLVAIIFAQFVVLALVFKLNSDNADQTRSIQEGIRKSQFEGCVLAGNVLRKQVREEFVDLKQKVMIPVYAGVAHTLPAEAPVQVILDGTVRYLEQRIRTIDERIPNADCLDLYPPLEGQTYPPGLIHKALRQAEAFHVDPQDLSRNHNRGGDSDAHHHTSGTTSDSGPAPGSEPTQPGAAVGGDDGTSGGGVGQPPSAPGPQPTPPAPGPPSPPPSPPQSPPAAPPAHPAPSGLQGAVNGAAQTVHGVCSTVNAVGLPVKVPC